MTVEPGTRVSRPISTRLRRPRAAFAGGLVAFSTETVYGLGADAGNGEAVARLYAAKGRLDQFSDRARPGYRYSGTRWAGPAVQIGYLAQGHETEPPHLTPIQFVRNTKPMYEEDAVALLGRFLFRYDQMRQPVGTLSGGERTRLQLCLLMLSGANCLLLDEPTNHLDIESMEVLEGALEGYDGTVIVISHDRYLLDRIPDRIVEVRDGRAFSSPGGYDDWLSARQQVRA